MTPQNLEKLKKRVAAAAGAAYREKLLVTPIDVLIGVGWLHPGRVEDWRKGRIPYLESEVSANLKRISTAMKFFRTWAASAGLNPSATVYQRRTRSGKQTLQFSKSGNPNIEAAYCTHFVSPKLRAEKAKRLAEKETKPKGLIVYSVLKTAKCDDCESEIGPGHFLIRENESGLCMKCAQFGHLEFLASGDAALTRRAKKYSQLWAVVVRFSRSRKRYERQGLLVEPPALRRAHEELAVGEPVEGDCPVLTPGTTRQHRIDNERDKVFQHD